MPRPGLRIVVMQVEHSTFEKHFRIGDLALMWSLGRETVRKLVKDDPGVIKIRMGRKKAHTVYSVPESAAQRIHTRLLNCG
jgi:type IV secretory pathway TrbD component